MLIPNEVTKPSILHCASFSFFFSVLPICYDFTSSSQNGRHFHFHPRFEPIREFVLVRRKLMFIYVVAEDIELFRLILSFQFIRVKNKLFVLLKKQKKGLCFTYKDKVLKNAK